jgi:hypothetical protein
MAANYFQRLKQANLYLQSWWRGKFHRIRFLRIIYAAKVINKTIRGHIIRREVRKWRFIRSIVDDMVDRGTMQLMNAIRDAAATEIQKWVRGH